MFAVSACLLGIDCKYSGGNNKNEKVIEFIKGKDFIAICPEQMGGLSTPRNPSEIKGGRGEDVLDKKATVISNTGADVTENFVKGAVESFKLAELSKVDTAILKNGSPSCGSSRIYDGSFSKRKIAGEGVTAALFRKNGINVLSEDDI